MIAVLFYMLTQCLLGDDDEDEIEYTEETTEYVKGNQYPAKPQPANYQPARNQQPGGPAYSSKTRGNGNYQQPGAGGNYQQPGATYQQQGPALRQRRVASPPQSVNSQTNAPGNGQSSGYRQRGYNQPP